jgi:ribulose 1,5-bisphosphate synthetase/thiazole synthase
MDTLRADVVVVGGGPSGFGAAISAAREGARVLLLEEDAVLGGAAVDYGVQGFSPGIVCGVNQEIRNILTRKDYTFRHKRSEFSSHWYAHACSMIAAHEANLTVLPPHDGYRCDPSGR